MIRLVEVVTTVATEHQAEQIARTVLFERLAACANVVRCRSFYTWKGDWRAEPEFVIHLKTLEAVAPRLELRLREIHPYETPAILRLPVLSAEVRYAEWVAGAVDWPPREPAP